jgi:hypothetical protein
MTLSTITHNYKYDNNEHNDTLIGSLHQGSLMACPLRNHLWHHIGWYQNGKFILMIILKNKLLYIRVGIVLIKPLHVQEKTRTSMSKQYKNVV